MSPTDLLRHSDSRHFWLVDAEIGRIIIADESCKYNSLLNRNNAINVLLSDFRFQHGNKLQQKILVLRNILSRAFLK